MANVYEISEEEAAAYAEWARTRAPVVQAIAERLAFNKLYRLKSTGHRVTLYSISEHGTVTVNVTGQFNLIDYDRRVFGINPDDLEECDLPAADEPLGACFTNEEEVRQYIAATRPLLLAARKANPADPYGKKKH